MSADDIVSRHVSRRAAGLGAGILTAVGLLDLVAPSAGATASPTKPTILATPRKVIIGRSVQGRAIAAYHLGDPASHTTSLLLASIHGNEHAATTAANAVLAKARAGFVVAGVNLWIVPVVNPDGYAHWTRWNAHRVDLNRNWGYRFVSQNKHTRFYSGPHAFSEPETRALKAFIQKVRPRLVASLHQPYGAVDAGGITDRAFQRALAKNLDLPSRVLGGTGVSHGTMTSWIDHTIGHSCAITVEFSAAPRRGYLTGRARDGLVTSLGGTWAKAPR